MLSARQFVNLQNATLHVKNLKMQSVMLNVRNLLVRFTVLIKLVRSNSLLDFSKGSNVIILKIEKIVQNALLYVKLLTVSLIVK